MRANFKGIIVCITLTIFFTNVSRGQITNAGTDFWFGFPEVLDSTTASFDVYVSSLVNSTGTVSVPGQGFSQNFTVAPGGVAKISIPYALVEVTSAEVIENKAIHVTSNNNVVVYAHTAHTFRADATLILPVSALGNEYYVASYIPTPNTAGPRPSEFLLIGPGTPVTLEITPSSTTVTGKPANVPFNITLNPGEVYQVQDTVGDLTGSRVRAVNPNDKFSVIGGCTFTNVPISCSSTNDPIYEQLFPVSSWGRNYIFLPTPLLNDDVCRVIASKNGTNVSINGAAVATLNAGQFYETSIMTPSLITGDQPISVARYMKGATCVAVPVRPAGSTTGLALGDPALVMIDANEQMYLDTITFFASALQNIDSNYVQIVTRTADINTIILDGVNMGPRFTAFAPNPFYSHMYIRVDSGAHTIESAGCGFLAYITGLGRAESYAYAAGVGLNNFSSFFAFPDSVCRNTPVPFSATSIGSSIAWLWEFGDGDTSTLQSPSHPYLSAGTYTVKLTVTYNGGCTDTLTKDITVYSCTTLSTSATATDALCNAQCSGTATTTPLNGITPYTYSWNSTPVQTTQTATGLCAGSYTVTVTDSTGATTTASVVVGEPTALTSSSVGTDVNCNGASTGTATVTASGGTGTLTYSWNTTPVQTSPTATGLTAGNYIVTVTDSNSCVTSDTVLITQPPLLTASVTPSNVLCNGGSTGAATVVSSGGTGSHTYSWSTSPVQTAPTATGLAAGNYSVTVTDSNNCTTTQGVSITEPAVLVATAVTTGNVCNGQNGSASVTASGGTSPYTYFWNTTSTNSQITNLTPGTYFVTVTDSNNCTSGDTVTISVVPPPPVNAGADVEVCAGSSVQLLATGAATYIWQASPYLSCDSCADPIATTSVDTFFVVTGELNGCTASDTINITVRSAAVAFAGPDTTIIFGNSVQLFSDGGTNFTWTPATALDDSTSRFPVARPLQTTTYCVIIKDTSGCVDTACTKVTVDIICGELFVPNAFSPNGDHQNDVACVLGIDCIKTYVFRIFDRWGEKIFESYDPQACWDGIYHDKPMNAAVFAYTLRAEMLDGRVVEKKGNISLIR